MKKNYILSGLMLIAALSLASCAKEQFVEQPAEKAGVPFEIVAGVDVTKTAAVDLSTINWVADDAIAVFYTAAGSTTYGTNHKFTISSADLATNTFRAEIPSITNDSNDWYAIYPWKSATKPSGTDYSVGGNATQDFNNPMAHLAGEKFPLYGKATSIAKGSAVVLPMKQAMSIIKVHVTNNSGAALDVHTVAFSTEDYNIAGTFTINFVNDTPVFTTKSAGKTATLSVSNRTSLAVGASNDYYIAVAPFEAAAGKKIKLKVNDLEREVTLPAATTFASGKVKTLNFNYNKITKSATLPFAIDGKGKKAAYSSVDGLSSYGLGSDYGDSHDPYFTKFDNTDDYVQVFFDKAARQVNFGVKMIGGSSTSYFYLTGSADGVTYSDIETFTVSGNSNDILSFTSSEDIDPSYRYLRLTFKKGSNVGMGPLSITEADNRSDVTLSFEDNEHNTLTEVNLTTANYNTFGGLNLKVEPNFITGSYDPIIWTSTDPNGIIEELDCGDVTLNGKTGVATVTATFNGDVNYRPAVASYTISVTPTTTNDGSLEHPYTVTEALGIIGGYTSGTQSATEVYVSGIVASVGSYNSTYHSVTYYISDDGQNTNTLNIFGGKFVANTNFSSNTQIAVNDAVIVKGYLYLYNTTKEMAQNNYIYSLNGITKALIAGSLTATPNNANKQITVEWGAATGTDSQISYAVTCGTQNYNAIAAGSHTFTMADYGSYDVSVVATATDAISATVSTVATLSSSTAPAAGTVLWTDTFGSWGGSSTTFSQLPLLSTYTYTGRSGYNENTDVTLSASTDDVRGATSSGANCTSGHLWFNKSKNASVTTSAIRLYGATSLILTYDQGTSGSSITAEYSINGGTTWTAFSASGPAANITYNFVVPSNTESVLLRFSHVSTNAKNTRFDNPKLTVGN